MTNTRETSLRFHTKNPLALSKYYGTIKLDIYFAAACFFVLLPNDIVILEFEYAAL